ncbi:MAG: hypothetical protein WCX71_01870 [Candidatus Buchananbacteria bacterium]
MTTAKKHLMVFILILVFYCLPTLVLAASITEQMKGALGSVALPTGDEDKALGFVGSAIAVFLSLLGILFLGLVIYGGAIWMTARGQEEKIDQAKDILKAAITGLIITLSAYGISYFVTSRLQETLTK